MMASKVMRATRVIMMMMVMGCAPFTYNSFTYHPFYLQIVGRRVGFHHHHHYRWSSIGRNDPNLVSKIKQGCFSSCTGPNHNLPTTMVPPKIKDYFVFVRLITCLPKLLSVDETQSHFLHLLNFSHCAFSNVFSNRLPKKRQSHTGRICLTFSIVRFQMSPQITYLRRCKVTLVAFV